MTTFVLDMNFGTAHIKIFVYADDHPPPHCHLLRKDGTETRVAIPTMIILTGPKLSKKEENLVLDNLDALCDEFERLNPPTH